MDRVGDDRVGSPVADLTPAVPLAQVEFPYSSFIASREPFMPGRNAAFRAGIGPDQLSPLPAR